MSLRSQEREAGADQHELDRRHEAVEVDDELAKLKAELGSGAKPKEPGS